MPNKLPLPITIACATLVFCAVACTCTSYDCDGAGSKFIFFANADDTDFLLSSAYTIDSVTVTPLLIDAGGPAPGYEIDVTDIQPFHVNLGTNDNTRGYVLRIGHLAPDTLLFRNGVEAPSRCCPGTITIDQVLLNGDTLANDRTEPEITIYK